MSRQKDLEAYDVSLTKEETNKAIAKVNNDKDSYANMGMSNSDRIKYAKDEGLKIKNG